MLPHALLLLDDQTRSVGLATAIALRGRGFSVTVADPAQPPIDKACGEGLMPDALASLALGEVRFGPGSHETSSLAFRRSLFVVEDIKEGVVVR